MPCESVPIALPVSIEDGQFLALPAPGTHGGRGRGDLRVVLTRQAASKIPLLARERAAAGEDSASDPEQYRRRRAGTGCRSKQASTPTPPSATAVCAERSPGTGRCRVRPAHKADRIDHRASRANNHSRVDHGRRHSERPAEPQCARHHRRGAQRPGQSGPHSQSATSVIRLSAPSDAKIS